MSIIDIRLDTYYWDINDPSKFRISLSAANDVFAVLYNGVYILDCTLTETTYEPNLEFASFEDAWAFIIDVYVPGVIGYINYYSGISNTLGDIYYYTNKKVGDLLATIPQTQDDLADGTTYKQYSATEKTKLAGIATSATANPTQAHIADGATNAATNAPTNLNVITTLLGTLTGEVNATNTKQNDLATKYNDLATKFNTLLGHLESNNILATS